MKIKKPLSIKILQWVYLLFSIFTTGEILFASYPPGVVIGAILKGLVLILIPFWALTYGLFVFRPIPLKIAFISSFIFIAFLFYNLASTKYLADASSIIIALLYLLIFSFTIWEVKKSLKKFTYEKR